MNINLKFFKKFKSLPVDQFYNNVLYDKNIGYYNSVTPFGKKGDFITAPKISNIFSEMIAIWIISTWENFGKPKNLSLVELGLATEVLPRYYWKCLGDSRILIRQNKYIYSK